MDYQKKYLKYKNKYYKFLLNNKITKHKMLGGNYWTYTNTALNAVILITTWFLLSRQNPNLQEQLEELKESINNSIEQNKITPDAIYNLIQKHINMTSEISIENIYNSLDKLNTTEIRDLRTKLSDMELREHVQQDLTYSGLSSDINPSSDKDDELEHFARLQEIEDIATRQIAEHDISAAEEDDGLAAEEDDGLAAEEDDGLAAGGSPDSGSITDEHSLGDSPDSEKLEGDSSDSGSSSDLKHSLGGSPNSEEDSESLPQSADGSPNSEEDSESVRHSAGGSPNSEEDSEFSPQSDAGSPKSVESTSSVALSDGGSPVSFYESTSSLTGSLGGSPVSFYESTSSVVQSDSDSPVSYNTLEDESNLSKTSYYTGGETDNSLSLNDLSETSVGGGGSGIIIQYDKNNYSITKSIFLKFVENLKNSKKINISKMNIDCMNKMINKIKKHSNINNSILLDFKNVVNKINKSIKKHNYNNTCNMEINKYLMSFSNKL